MEEPTYTSIDDTLRSNKQSLHCYTGIYLKEKTPETYSNKPYEHQEENKGSLSIPSFGSNKLQSCLENTPEFFSVLPRDHQRIFLSMSSHYEIPPTTIQEDQDRIDSLRVHKGHKLPKDEMVPSSIYEISPRGDSISSYDSGTFLDDETDHRYGSSFHNIAFPNDDRETQGPGSGYRTTEELEEYRKRKSVEKTFPKEAIYEISPRSLDIKKTDEHHNNEASIDCSNPNYYEPISDELRKSIINNCVHTI